jgi:hypothetical protein
MELNGCWGEYGPSYLNKPQLFSLTQDRFILNKLPSVDLPIALWPWGRFNLRQKWVPGVFPRVKGGRCVRLTTLPPSCAVVKKSGNLNFVEPSGPLQACNGTALPKLPSHVCYMFRPVLGPSSGVSIQIIYVKYVMYYYFNYYFYYVLIG